LAVLAGIKSIWNCYAMPRILVYRTGYLLGFQKICSQNSFLRDWVIVRDDIHPKRMFHDWTKSSDLTKLSVIPTICNLSFVRICASGCTFLALIRLGSAPVSIMKTRSGNNPLLDIIVMGEAGHFLEFIIAILHSLPLVPSPEFLSRSLDVSYSGPLEVRPLTSRSFASFPKNYSVNYCIDICNIFQFRALYSYNNGTIWASVHFLLFPIPYSYYLNYEECIYH